MKKTLSLMLAFMLTIGSAVTSFAADLDFIHKSGNPQIPFVKATKDLGSFVKITKDMPSYLVEFGGKFYKVEDINNFVKANPGKTIADAVASGIVAQPKPSQSGDLEVISISAVNPTKLLVKFSKAVAPEQLAKENFSLSKGTIESVVKTGESEATISVAGLTYGDTLTAKVLNPVFQAEVNVPKIGELYTLKVASDAEKNTIKSDGASMTMLTAEIIENATGTAIVQDAQIQFNATLGSLSQPEVALAAGKASTQLRSISSPESVISVVTVVVASAPGAPQYVGLSGQLIVAFTPDGTADETANMVMPVKAGSDQGDRFFVEFSSDIKAEDYMKAIKDLPVLAAGVADYGIRYVNKTPAAQPIAIKGVYNIRPNTLMFVLDTDDDASAAPATTRLDGAYAGPVAKNFLRDNVNHKIIFPNNIGKLVINAGTVAEPITFMMSDVTKPFVYSVKSENNMSIEVKLSEAIAEDLAEGAEGALNGKLVIDGKQLRLFEAAPATPAQVALAKTNDELIVTQLKVGKYTDKDNDTRNMIYIKLHKDFKLKTGNHGIQISNVGDWAGLTDDPQNIVKTQTFAFEVAEDTGKPAVTVEAQSPEQWLISFDRPVDTVTGKTIEDAIKLYSKEGFEKDPKEQLVQANAVLTADDYVISSFTKDKDGNREYSTFLAKNAVVSDVDGFLVEFSRDWSVKQKGQGEKKNNYWKSELNPFQVVVDHLESATGVKMDKATLPLTLNYDGVSPEIAKAADLYEMLPDKEFRTIPAANNNRSGQFVYVEMTEPVQLVKYDGTQQTLPSTPSLEQDPTLLPANYNGTNGLPRPTYRFVKEDKTVLGDPRDLLEDDMSFVIEPRTPLAAGEWTLYIEQISDDHGNTSATISKKVVVPEGEAVATDTAVSWIGFDNHNTDYDYIYVKFTKPMKAYTANGVDATTNYKFRGYDLILGTFGAQIEAGLEGLTEKSDWDAVTIKLAKESWDGILPGPNFDTNFTLASNFVSANGEKLSPPYQVELSHIAGGSVADKDGLNASNRLEALYLGNESGLVGGAPVIKVEAADVNDDDGLANKDGKFDKFTLTLAVGTKKRLENTDRFYINGKEYQVDAAPVAPGVTTVNLVPVASADQLTPAETPNAKLTSVSGALIASKVKAPVLALSATLNADKDKITVKFSDRVSKDFTGAGVEEDTFAAAAFTLTDNAPNKSHNTTFTVAPTAVAYGSTKDTLIFDVINGEAIGKGDTITVPAMTVYPLFDTTAVATIDLVIKDADDVAPEFKKATTVQTQASKQLLAAAKEFTVKAMANGPLDGAFGNNIEVEILAADIGAGASLKAEYNAKKLTITLNNNGAAGPMTVQNALDAINAVQVDGKNAFVAELSGTGAGGTALAASDTVVAAKMTGGKDVVTVTFSEIVDGAAAHPANGDIVIAGVSAGTIAPNNAKAKQFTFTIAGTDATAQVKGSDLSTSLVDQAGNAFVAGAKIKVQ